MPGKQSGDDDEFLRYVADVVSGMYEPQPRNFMLIISSSWVFYFSLHPPCVKKVNPKRERELEEHYNWIEGFFFLCSCSSRQFYLFFFPLKSHPGDLFMRHDERCERLQVVAVYCASTRLPVEVFHLTANCDRFFHILVPNHTFPFGRRDPITVFSPVKSHKWQRNSWE